MLLLILGLPLLLAIGALLIKKTHVFGSVNAVGYSAVVIASVLLLKNSPVFNNAEPAGFFYVDTLSAFFIFVAATVALATALYSIGYIKKDITKGLISEQKARYYYLFFNIFCFSMFLVPAVNSLGVLWVAIEITTLVSAFLVGFYNTKKSVEAAWKYIIICSAGIIFALLGTILFSYAFTQAGIKNLNWSQIFPLAAGLNKNIVKVAFIFILVGYGTKAGLAPLHTWLPDAHSQAVAPVSALLSGVLLKMALYAILRFGLIIIKCMGFSYFGNLMVLFGIISLVISCGLILVQKDLKRLLAYSSIEHIGIIALGLGIGTPLSILGAMLHIFNHAVTKSLMFFSAGNMVAAYDKHSVHSIRGALKVLPFTGVMSLIGLFALTGLPPFALFGSELMILIGAFNRGAYFIAVLFLICIVIVFGGFVYRYGEMLFGKRPKGMVVIGEPLSGKLSFLLLLFLICIVGPFFILNYEEFTWIVWNIFYQR